MKKVLITGFIVALSLLIIPLAGIKKGTEAVETIATAHSQIKSDKPNEESMISENDKFRIKTADKIVTLSAKEYIAGVLAAEMPTDFEPEALKAQSVAAYSFALCRKAEGKNKDYDLTDSYQTDQSYLSEEEQKEKWGDAYEEKSAKIKEAVEATLGEYLSFEKKPALTLYHALSPGVTNFCSDVFGSELPYLVSVDSESDRLSPNYKSVFSFSADELSGKLSSIKKVNTSGENLFSDIKSAKSGLILSLKYADAETSGAAVSGLLGLPSAAFTIEFLDSGYTFTCVGHGHGVGMSQYGAEAMAQAGADYKEILSHYYPGTQLTKN